MGRFAGLIITLGVGAAVLSGHGLARAEPSDSSSDSSSGTSTNSPTAASTKSPSATSKSTAAQTRSDAPSTAVRTGDSPSTATPSTVPSNAQPASKDPTALTAPATAPLHQPSGKSLSDTSRTMPTRKSTISSSAAASEKTSVRKDDFAHLAVPMAQKPSVATAQLTATIGDVPLASVSAAEPTLQRTDSSQVAAAVPAEPVEVIAGVVSNLLGGLLHPLATGSAPETPTGAPAMWSLLAFARREFETARTPASVADVPTVVQTTTQTLVTDTPVAGLQAQAVENSLTYTPPPTIIDQLTVAGLRLVRDITGFFGIPYTAVLSQLITSEDPPFFLTLGLHARQTEFEVSPGDVWKVWEFEPRHPTGATVVAIHGGGAIYQPNLLHWIDYTQMARATGATVLVPLYPLARTEAGSLLNVTPGMADYISHVIDDRGAQNVSVYADSEGATYAFAAARELILRGDDVPASMVVMSAQADYSTENDGAGIDDPFFNKVTIEYFSKGVHTFDGIIDKDPRISPLRMETEVLQALPPTTMYVGTEEILLPANLLLYQRAVDIGAPISMVVGRGQFHDWPLAGLPVNSAAPLVRRDIYRQLGLLPDAVNAAINEVGVSANGNCNPFTEHCGGDQPAGPLENEP
jgi:acetyl esterase/lipase